MRNGGGSAPFQVDSSIVVDGLNADLVDGKEASAFLEATAQAADADTVDGFHAHQLMRGSYGQTANAAEPNGAAVSATVNAPVDRYLVMSGAVDAYGTVWDEYACRLTVGGTPVTGTKMWSAVHAQGVGYTTNDSENCATTGMTQVTAGSHTVALNIDGRDSAEFQEATVWAVFIPFDGTGATPSP